MHMRNYYIENKSTLRKIFNNTGESSEISLFPIILKHVSIFVYSVLENNERKFDEIIGSFKFTSLHFLLFSNFLQDYVVFVKLRKINTFYNFKKLYTLCPH